MSTEGPGNAPDEVFTSSIPFEAARTFAVAITCSDGRWGDQVDEFLHLKLGLPRYDRLAIPGGAVGLAGHLRLFREDDTLTRELRFLVDSHRLTRAILIAHQDCAVYRERVQVEDHARGRQQRLDLKSAAARIRQFFPELRIETFVASIHDGRVSFEPVA